MKIVSYTIIIKDKKTKEEKVFLYDFNRDDSSFIQSREMWKYANKKCKEYGEDFFVNHIYAPLEKVLWIKRKITEHHGIN